ncbi:unnamed protein product [Brachionus calyciflorus]|nr:unnamed protein product [Brachionus calyciflorus]
MSKLYTTRAPNRRRPVCVFYKILNPVIINSWVLYKKVNFSKIARQDFIINLIEEILAFSENNLSKKQPVTPSIKRKNSNDISAAQQKTPKQVRKNVKLSYALKIKLLKCVANLNFIPVAHVPQLSF